MGFFFESKLLYVVLIYCVCVSYGCFFVLEIEICCLVGLEI